MATTIIDPTGVSSGKNESQNMVADFNCPDMHLRIGIDDITNEDMFTGKIR